MCCIPYGPLIITALPSANRERSFDFAWVHVLQDLSRQKNLNIECLQINHKKCNFLLCCRCCQAPLCMFFSSILNAVALGLACSGAFLWCGNLASRTTVSPCGLSHPSTVSRCVLSAISNGRLCIALRVRSPPWMPLEDAIDRTTRGQ